MGLLERLRQLLRRRRPPALHVAIDIGTGPVVVLVHGIASSSVTFDRLVPLLSKTHRVVSIDLLGFGRSPTPPHARYTIEEHVASVREAIRRLRLREPYILVGHSMGALIASRLASTNPSRLVRLVLISPPIYVDPEALADRRERATMDIFLRAYEFLRSNKAFTMLNAEVLARLSPIKDVLVVSESTWEAFRLSLENAIESQTTISDIASVRVPVDIVYGSLDPFLVPSGLRIVETMRHVTMHRVEVSDHLVRKRLARAVAAVIETGTAATPVPSAATPRSHGAT